MNSNENHELERLLNALVDGGLSASEQKTLEEILRNEQAARQRYRRFAVLHADLHWDASALVPLVLPSVDGARGAGSEAGPSRRKKFALLAVATGFAAALALLCYPFITHLAGHGADQFVVSVLSIEGVASWSGEGRVIRLDPLRGHKLTAGTLYLEGDAPSCRVRFRDGTDITLTGESELLLLRRWPEAPVVATRFIDGGCPTPAAWPASRARNENG